MGQVDTCNIEKHAEKQADLTHGLYELLYLLNLAQLTPPTWLRIEILLFEIRKSDEKYNEFFDLVRLNAVGVLVSKRLIELSQRVVLPVDFMKKLNALSEEVQANQRRMQAQMDFLPLLLKALGGTSILLKGSLFAHTLYDDPIYKKMNDLDVLIPSDHLKEAVVALCQLGLICIEPGRVEKIGKSSSDELQNYIKKTHHFPSLIHPKKGLVVGLHWGIHAPRAPWRSDIDGIWQRSVQLPERAMNGSLVWRMSWEDQLIHLCIHLPFFKIGLRELADVYNLIQFSQPQVDWTVFCQRVEEWDAIEPVYRVLTLALACVVQGGQPYHDTELEFYLKTWKKQCSHFYRQDTQQRSESKVLLFRSRSTHLAKIEKAFLVFRATENYFEKLKFLIATWTLTFGAPITEVRKIALFFGKRGSLAEQYARMRTPVLIIRALALDHGAPVLMMLTVVNIGIMMKETVQFSFLKKKPSLLYQDGKSLLEVLE